jgi:hypothetical protein
VGAQFGEWVTDGKTGTAHYVLDGKCLCGAKIAKPAGPPKRKPVASQAGKEYGALATPLCEECKTLNENRWLGRKGTEMARRKRWTWWRGAGRARK